MFKRLSMVLGVLMAVVVLLGIVAVAYAQGPQPPTPWHHYGPGGGG